MLVGDVREATSGEGSSWKLSGGSQFSLSLTKVSKKCQVLRAARRKNASCSPVNETGAASMARLSHQAMKGAANHARKKGAADQKNCGVGVKRAIPAARATTGAIHILA